MSKFPLYWCRDVLITCPTLHLLSWSIGNPCRSVLLSMKKKITILILLIFTISCGDYLETKIDLEDDERTAISNYLSADCVNKNVSLFNQLSTSTSNWDIANIDENFKYQYSNTSNNEAKELIILKRTTDTMYIYVQSTDAETKNRVYRYTTTDNANHINSLKAIACAGGNTFSGDGNNFSYSPVLYSPNDQDTNRTEHTATYQVDGDRPVFFSLFDRQYQKVRYEEDIVKENINSTVSLVITTTPVDSASILSIKNAFDDLDHCTFTADWLGADYPTTLSAAISCATGTFNWDTDIGL